MQKHIYIKINGRVQGVGFRIYTKKLALIYHITGTVTNTLDGSVVIYAQGNDNQLKTFTKEVTNGASPYSKVTDYKIEQLPLTNYQNFQIIK